MGISEPYVGMPPPKQAAHLYEPTSPGLIGGRDTSSCFPSDMAMSICDAIELNFAVGDTPRNDGITNGVRGGDESPEVPMCISIEKRRIAPESIEDGSTNMTPYSEFVNGRDVPQPREVPRYVKHIVRIFQIFRCVISG